MVRRGQTKLVPFERATQMSYKKNTLRSALAFACFAIFTVTLTANPAQADTYGHIQKLALETQIKADRLMGETHHYVHTPNYRRMLAAVSELRQEAVQVHVLSIQHGCLDAMSRHIARLDALYHETEELFDYTEEEASYGHGHVHGATSHVKDLLKCIEDNVHHIRDDVAALRRPVYRRPVYLRPSYTRPVYQAPVYAPPVYKPSRGHGHSSHSRTRVRYEPGCSRDRGGVSISKGNFNIRIGF